MGIQTLKRMNDQKQGKSEKKKKGKSREDLSEISRNRALWGYSKNTLPFLPQLPVQSLLYYKLAKYF